MRLIRPSTSWCGRLAVAGLMLAVAAYAFRGRGAIGASGSTEKADFWAFKSAERPGVPGGRERGWGRNEVDRFILAGLEREGLTPSPEADRRTLIRRVTFDLTGLPPTPEAIAAFVGDSRPNAYEDLVERLLASPRYGERWGRHWLDVVHFGETHGYDKDKPRPNAWRYRDYVIAAFNDDEPYPRFVREQLAGDVLFPGDPRGTIATGFIAAGPWDFVGHLELREGTTDKQIARSNDRDDMVMTAMSTFQSLTVHCARCHDHKFDPITQADYYRLQAVFAGVDRGDREFDADPKVAAERAALKSRRAALEGRLKSLEQTVARAGGEELAKLDARLSERRTKLAALRTSQPSPSNGYHSNIEATPDVVKWVQVDLGESRALDEIRLIPARPTDFPDTPGFGFPARYKVEASDHSDFSSAVLLIDHIAADVPNPGDAPVVISAKSAKARYVRVTAAKLWPRVSNGQRDYVFALAELQAMSGGRNVGASANVTAADSIEGGRWSKRFLVDGFDSRGSLWVDPHGDELLAAIVELRKVEKQRGKLIESRLDADSRTELAELSARLADIDRQLADLKSEDRVYAAVPLAAPRPIHLLARGDVKQPRQLMPAGTLVVFNGIAPEIASADGGFRLANPGDEGARRAALARWLTEPGNLLTRRSIVNRVWQYHFGRGIVETPNDFGHMGAAPSHPELLDYLAFWFVDHGESIKSLHRLLVTSSAYRQVSTGNELGDRKDADNRLLWRMNRTRLDAEEIRDALLAASGKLDLTMGGPSARQFFFKDDHSPVYDYTRFDIDSDASRRRGVYRFIVRSVPDPLMETLDCPDASLLTPRRNTTITALQALSLMNNPFVIRQCEHLAERVSARSSGDVKGQVRAIYELTLGRAPTSAESKLLCDYATEHGMANACRVLVNSNEFVFVD